LISCGADEGDSLVTIHRDSDNYAPFLTFDDRDVIINISDATPSYTFTVSDPSGADVVASYDVSVSWTNSSGNSDTVSIGSYNTFPQTITYTLGDLATVLDTVESDFLPGDSFTFLAEVTGTNGVTIDFFDLTGDAQNSQGLAQALRHVVFIACPFNAEEIVGTYTVTSHFYGDVFFGADGTGTTREVIAGPGENQYTIVGGPLPSNGSDDLIVTVDPESGVVSYGGEPGKAFDGFGLNPDYLGLSGFTFSCAGSIDIAIQTACCIDNPFSLTKN